MPLDYDLDLRLKKLSPVLDDVIHFYANLALFVSGDDVPIQPKIQSFRYWYQDVLDDDYFQDYDLKTLQARYETFMDSTQSFIQTGADHRKNQFKIVTEAYIEFCDLLRRIEEFCISGDVGMDVLTGLKTPKMLFKDFAAEISRVTRGGDHFVIFLASIDFFEQVTASNEPKAIEDLVLKVADMIKRVVRDFDDAYYMDNGEYMLILRQSNIDGSFSASNRLQEVVKKDGATILIDGEKRALSVSSTIADPLPGDDLKNLITRMRDYLKESDDQSSAIHEYKELSPVEMFVQSQDD